MSRVHESVYATFSDNPVLNTDPDGAKPVGPIGEFIDRINRGAGHVFGKSRLFKFQNRRSYRLIKVAGEGEGTATGIYRQGGMLTPDERVINVGKIVRGIEMFNQTPPMGYLSQGMQVIQLSQSLGATFRPASIIDMDFGTSVIQLDGLSVPTDFKFGSKYIGTNPIGYDGNDLQPDIYPTTNREVITLKAKVNQSYLASINVSQRARILRGGDNYSVRNVSTEFNYRYRFTQEEIRLADGRVVGWQDARPGTPGAKPLWRHSVRYIIRYLIKGWDGVDLGKKENFFLRKYEK